MDSTKDTAGPASYVDIMEKNHMEIPWHDYAKAMTTNGDRQSG